MEKFKPIHQHLLIKAQCRKVIKQPAKAKKMLTDLVNLVGMVPVTKPQAVYINTPGNEGLTGGINLATSHLCFHIWDDTKMLMLDLYSCCAFDNMEVLEFLNKLFDFEQVEFIIIDRETMRTSDVITMG